MQSHSSSSNCNICQFWLQKPTGVFPDGEMRPSVQDSVKLVMTLILLCVTVSFTPRVPSAFALWLVVRQFTLLSACEVSEVCCSWVFPEEGGSSLPRRIPCRVDQCFSLFYLKRSLSW